MRNRAPTSSPSSPPCSAERLGRGDFVRLIYRLARAHATGVLTIFAAPPPVPPIGHAHTRPVAHGPFGGPAGRVIALPLAGSGGGTGVRPAGSVLVLRRGHLMAADADAGSGRQTALRLERLAAIDNGRFYFDGGVAAYPPGALIRQYNLAAWARAHLEAQFDAAHAHAMTRELAGIRLALRPELAPELAWCDETDRRILAALAVPRRLDQVGTLARATRFRLLSFLYFLRAVGAVTLGGVAAPAPSPRGHDDDACRVLGVPAGADRETVKRAYRRLARALHPDLHGASSDERRRQLERKLADVNLAYRRLVDATA